MSSLLGVSRRQRVLLNVTQFGISLSTLVVFFFHSSLYATLLVPGHPRDVCFVRAKCPIAVGFVSTPVKFTGSLLAHLVATLL